MSAGLDPILEHGEAEGAVGYQQRSLGLSGHGDPFLADLGPNLFFGEDSSASGAAAEAVIPGLRHLLDPPPCLGKDAPGLVDDVHVAPYVAGVVVGGYKRLGFEVEPAG